jgi:hypothetical protein
VTKVASELKNLKQGLEDRRNNKFIPHEAKILFREYDNLHLILISYLAWYVGQGGSLSNKLATRRKKLSAMKRVGQNIQTFHETEYPSFQSCQS